MKGKQMLIKKWLMNWDSRCKKVSMLSNWLRKKNRFEKWFILISKSNNNVDAAVKVMTAESATLLATIKGWSFLMMSNKMMTM